jgi:RNA polymerase-binding transcription factor DksA
MRRSASHLQLIQCESTPIYLMAKHKKHPTAAKKVHKVAAKPAPKKAAPVTAKKSAPAVAVAPAAPAEPKKKSAVSNSEKQTDKASARDLLRSRILGGKKAAKPIAFSLDEVREIAKTAAAAKTATAQEEPKPRATPAKPAKVDVTKTAKPAQPNHVKPASLADILGFNPKKAQPANVDDSENVPEKFRRYYKLLLDLRSHLTEGLSLHTEETLKRSSKDDSGDLSSYGQHMADAGTDTFDRDFALSLVSSEQEALTEIDAAIKRIHDGTYGVCEVTGKPIAKERLLAVPFTRYSAEAQKEIEKNRMRTRTSAGLFGELGEEGAKIEDDGGDE